VITAGRSTSMVSRPASISRVIAAYRTVISTLECIRRLRPLPEAASICRSDGRVVKWLVYPRKMISGFSCLRQGKKNLPAVKGSRARRSEPDARPRPSRAPYAAVVGIGYADLNRDQPSDVANLLLDAQAPPRSAISIEWIHATS